MNAPVVTVDGPAGVGKGTLAKELAKSLCYHYLDSGAIYRALAFAGSQQNLNPEVITEWLQLAQGLRLNFPADKNFHASIDGNSIEAAIRTEQCAAMASKLAENEQLRAALVDLQHRFQQSPGLVAEGRDMGTVIFPTAACKIFLQASVEERALRRHKQLKEKGIDANFDALLNTIRARDERDSSRKVAPLVAASDAMVLDTTQLSADEVLEKALLWCKRKHITE